ncbi:MAG: rRNA adenine N-6-methyltransferase family protein, partial [Candidatus Micrarchaeota archaeon]
DYGNSPKKAKKVVAIEIDADLASLLKERFKTSKNVEIICGDAMQSSFNYPVVIGFLPYHIISPILFKLLSSAFGDSILCVQKEFALRMVAEPGTSDYSKLSVMAQSKADITYLATVPKEAFSPVPKVDSALVYLVKNEKFKPNGPLISALFQHKNQSAKKAILHSLPQLKLSREQAQLLFSKADFSKRPRFMSLKELSSLSAAYDGLFTSKR